MKIDDVIAELYKVRASKGNIEVLVWNAYHDCGCLDLNFEVGEHEIGPNGEKWEWIDVVEIQGIYI